MQPSWQLAQACYRPERLEQLKIDTLPVIVCGVLNRLLPAAPGYARLRAGLARRLRHQLQAEWIKTAGLAEVFAALDGLQAYDPAMIGGADLAAAANRLVSAEVAVGGPYRYAGAIDPLANACIAQCMEWMAAPLPHVTAYLQASLPGVKAVETADWPLLAAVQAGSSPTACDAQLCAYLNVLNDAQCAAIMWRLQRHWRSDAAVTGGPASRIRAHCLRREPQFGEPFNTNTRTMLEQVMQADANREISQLAWYYGQALVSPPLEIGAEMYVRLGAANLYAWAAYTIYDDFLDDEGSPALLSTANYSLRAMLHQYYMAMPDATAFQEFIERVLAVVDQANAYETSYLRLPVVHQMLTVDRLPDFGSRDLLADRALFHILGPMGVMTIAGVAMEDKRWRHTMAAFRHYLIARQLNDDIHDWAKDLRAGQATYVVVELLRFLNITPGTYMLDRLMPHARQQFWQAVLPKVCNTALEHMAAARHNLQLGLPITNNNQLMRLFDYTENSMRAALAQRQRSRELLQAFGVSS